MGSGPLNTMYILNVSSTGYISIYTWHHKTDNYRRGITRFRVSVKLLCETVTRAVLSQGEPRDAAENFDT